MNTRKPLDMLAIGLMVVFCLCGGMQQVVLKATGDDISPVLQLALRSGIAALLIGLLALFRGEKLSLSDGSWKPGLVVGVLFTLEYLLLGEALRFTTASHAVVFLYTSPVFTALILHFLEDSERMSLLQCGGITLALAGVALAFLQPEQAGAAANLTDMLLGDTMALCAGAAWGASNVIIRTSTLARTPFKLTILYQLVVAFVLLFAAAVVLGQLKFNPTPQALGSLAFQSVVIAFAAFLIWFWLLSRYQVSRISVLSFMTPLLGVALGGWLLGETIEPGFLFGALLVIAGVILVSGEAWFKQLLGRPSLGLRQKA